MGLCSTGGIPQPTKTSDVYTIKIYLAKEMWCRHYKDIFSERDMFYIYKEGSDVCRMAVEREQVTHSFPESKNTEVVMCWEASISERLFWYFWSVFSTVWPSARSFSNLPGRVEKIHHPMEKNVKKILVYQLDVEGASQKYLDRNCRQITEVIPTAP